MENLLRTMFVFAVLWMVEVCVEGTADSSTSSSSLTPLDRSTIVPSAILSNASSSTISRDSSVPNSSYTDKSFSIVHDTRNLISSTVFSVSTIATSGSLGKTQTSIPKPTQSYSQNQTSSVISSGQVINASITPISSPSIKAEIPSATSIIKSTVSETRNRPSIYHTIPTTQSTTMYSFSTSEMTFISTLPSGITISYWTANVLSPSNIEKTSGYAVSADTSTEINFSAIQSTSQLNVHSSAKNISVLASQTAHQVSYSITPSPSATESAHITSTSVKSCGWGQECNSASTAQRISLACYIGIICTLLNHIGF